MNIVPILGASVTVRWRDRPQSATARISEPVAGYTELSEVREVSYLFLIPVSLFKFFLMKVVDHQN